MCLELKKPKIIVAKEDIICYKVMIECFGDKSKYSWVSPYKGMNYEKGHTYILGKQLELFHSFNKEYPYRIEEGFHSFANLSDALLFLNVYEVRSIEKI